MTRRILLPKKQECPDRLVPGGMASPRLVDGMPL